MHTGIQDRLLSHRGEELEREPLPQPFQRLKQVAAPKQPARPGDWLAEHRERGQSFVAYLRSAPERPAKERHTLYVRRLGAFSVGEDRVVASTVDFIGRFFQLPVRELPRLPSSAVPSSARRINPYTDVPQVLTSYVLDRILARNQPKDSLALIALTAEDLWPGEGWNFVFGQASLHERVGVWSLARNGDPESGAVGFRTCLRRTLATAVHELCHMLSMPHCIAFECVLNGSNSVEEKDGRPLDLCPVDTAKLCWNVGCDAVKRLQALLEFTRSYGLENDEHLLAQKLSVLRRH